MEVPRGGGGRLGGAERGRSRLALMARALGGDGAALQVLAHTPEATAAVVSNRLAPALANRAADLGIDGPAVGAWREQRRLTAARRMLLDHAADHACDVLAERGLRHVLLKGLGLPPAAYPRPEERPTSDIDVLIPAERLETARSALHDAGWVGAHGDPRAEAYLREEAYNWQARDARNTLLELHFRLWGSVPERLARHVLDRAEPTGRTGLTRRAAPADAYIVAAVHTWVSPPPRPLVYWWDLHRLASAEAFPAGEVEDAARRYGLQLFVATAAAVAARLWGGEVNHRVAETLRRELRRPERYASRFDEPAGVPYGRFVLARLLARRPSRLGWRSVWRRAWPHPGVLGRGSDPERSLTVRRIRHLVSTLRP